MKIYFYDIVIIKFNGIYAKFFVKKFDTRVYDFLCKYFYSGADKNNIEFDPNRMLKISNSFTQMLFHFHKEYMENGFTCDIDTNEIEVLSEKNRRLLKVDGMIND